MADPAAPRPRRIWRIVLVLSLALNLAVVGLVAGFALRGGKQGPPRAFDLSMGPIGQALRPEDRRAIASAIRQNRDLRPERGKPALFGVEDMIAALRADPFQPEDFAQSLKILEARQSKMRDAVREAVVAQITAMSDAERAAFAERLQDAGRKRN